MGSGEAFAYGAPLAVCNVIEESLAPLIVGQDPRRSSGWSTVMHRGTHDLRAAAGWPCSRSAASRSRCGTSLGKARGAPVYELLGGACPAAPARLREPAALRHAGRRGRRRAGAASPRASRRSSSTRSTWPPWRPPARRSGPDVELMLDTNCPWTPAEAIAMARALAPLRLRWLEEPVWPPEDYAGLGAGGARRRRSPIALRRERVHRATASARSSTPAPADILQPSITKVGGISEFKKIAALAAQAANVPSPRTRSTSGPGWPPRCTWPRRWAARYPVEFPTGDQETPFLTRPIQARDGWLERAERAPASASRSTRKPPAPPPCS